MANSQPLSPWGPIRLQDSAQLDLLSTLPICFQMHVIVCIFMCTVGRDVTSLVWPGLAHMAPLLVALHSLVDLRLTADTLLAAPRAAAAMLEEAR